MDNRSVGSRGSLYPDLKGETGSLDAPEALEVFSKGKVAGGRTRRSRARSPGPIGLQIDPTHMETFDGDNYCVGLYLDDGDGEQATLPSGAGGHTSTGSIGLSHSDSNDLLNGFDDSFIDNKSGGSVYGEVDLNDNDAGFSGLKPAASPRKNSRSHSNSRHTHHDSDSRSEGSRSVKSSRSVHTNPGVLLNDKAQRTRKSAPKQTTAAERLAQFGATITKVRSAGSMHSAGALHGRHTQTVDPPLQASANASGESSKYPSQMDNCGFDNYTSPKNAVWGQTGNVGAAQMPSSKQTTSLIQGQAPTGMHTDVITSPVKAFKSMINRQLPGHHREATTHDSRHSNGQNPVAVTHISDSQPRPYLQPAPTPMATHRAASYVPSAGNKQTQSVGSQVATPQHGVYNGMYNPHLGDSNLCNTGFPPGQSPAKPVTSQSSHVVIPPSAHVDMIGRMESLSIPAPQTHISAHSNISSFGRPMSSGMAERMPSAQVAVPHLGQSEYDKFQDALKHLKVTPATSQAPRQPPGPQTAGLKAPPMDAGVPYHPATLQSPRHHPRPQAAGLKAPPVDAGVPFHRPNPMEQHQSGPSQLPRLDHTMSTSPSVNERYPPVQQQPMMTLPTNSKKETVSTSSWGRSPLAGAPKVSKKGHPIIDNGTSNRVHTHGPLDSFSPPPPASATKKNKVKNVPSEDSDDTKPKKVSSFGSLGAMVGGIRRGKNK